MDLYLKFKNKEEADQYLFDVTPAVLNEDGDVIEQMRIKPKFVNIDVIGTIYKPTGEYEEVGEMLTPITVALDGYHVNIRVVPGEDASQLQQFAVNPTQPSRIWA